MGLRIRSAAIWMLLAMTIVGSVGTFYFVKTIRSYNDIIRNIYDYPFQSSVISSNVTYNFEKIENSLYDLIYATESTNLSRKFDALDEYFILLKQNLSVMAFTSILEASKIQIENVSKELTSFEADVEDFKIEIEDGKLNEEILSNLVFEKSASSGLLII